MTSAQFTSQFSDELNRGGVVGVDVSELMLTIERAALPRPFMLEAVRRLRKFGFETAALTNNWQTMPVGALRPHFDVVIESCVEGVRKPEGAIYQILVERLDSKPACIAFLDDIGANLKTARALGMTTIKVTDAPQALIELSRTLGIDLD